MEDLLQDIEQWVQEGASMSVQLRLLTTDSSCDVGISSFTDSECRASGDNEGSAPVGAIVGAVVGVSVVLVLVVIAVVAVVVVIRRNRHVTPDAKGAKPK